MTVRPDNWHDCDRDRFVLHISRAICEEQSLPSENVILSLREDPWPILWEKAETYAPYLIEDFSESVKETRGGSF